MKVLKYILGHISLLSGGFFTLYAGYAYVFESSPWHSADYFGFVFTILFGIPGIILFALGILTLKQKRVLFNVFGSVFVLIFLISLLELSRADSYMHGQILGFGICWLLAGVGYMLSASFLRNKKIGGKK